ncbi:NAD(P)-dependent oxidoreductase [Fusobacterium russii]|uniref:NAD(P)-dependent oxidoreductase n=1 Tax=Fusobacterium russii TaxID=854 RepID=UPI0003AAA1A6|nr:NAD(P)-dependent oxidoreductase [Fusobacterium russii]
MNYDIIHFEALGEEAIHLKEETIKAIKMGLLPENFTFFITSENLQNFLLKNENFILPKIITTKTHSIIPKDYLLGEKKSIITRSAGYDHFEDLQNIVNLASLREYCAEAVAQTAIKFVYATCGKLNEYTRKTALFERNDISSFIELGKNRIATVFGLGKIGIHIYNLLEANGLTVQAVDLREDKLKNEYGKEINFVSKEKALKNSDIIINIMNLNKFPDSKFYNVGYFSDNEFSIAKKGVVFINMSRGSIAPESILLKYYRKKIISGIGLDVFSNELAFSKFLRKEIDTEDKDLLAAKEIQEKALSLEENFYVQPHQGFNSDLAALSKAKETVKHICNWYKNNKKNFDEQLPYYN